MKNFQNILVSAVSLVLLAFAALNAYDGHYLNALLLAVIFVALTPARGGCRG